MERFFPKINKTIVKTKILKTELFEYQQCLYINNKNI